MTTSSVFHLLKTSSLIHDVCLIPFLLPFLRKFKTFLAHLKFHRRAAASMIASQLLPHRLDRVSSLCSSLMENQIKTINILKCSALTHLPCVVLWQRSARWQKPSLLDGVRRISRYHITIPIIYTHSSVKNTNFWIILEEVISWIKILRVETRRHVRILHTMPKTWRLFAPLLSVWFLFDTFFSRHIEFWIFLSPVTSHQFEIHLLFLRFLWYTHPKWVDARFMAQQETLLSSHETQELFPLSHPPTDTRRLDWLKLITFWLYFQVSTCVWNNIGHKHP